MIRRCIQLAAALLLFHFCRAQPGPGKPVEKWDLRKCVEYAMEHNISVRQADLQIRFAELDFKQSKLSQYPNANVSTSLGYGAGRNQDNNRLFI
jgi:outer membrane protein